MRQHAAISHAQALKAGLTGAAVSRRVDSGRWTRLLPRVYRVGGSPATGRQGMMAAALWAGDGALLSHRAAGVLHGLDGVNADRLEVTASRRLRSGVVLAHFAPPFTVIDRDVVDGIPATSATRTLIDLAGTLDTDSLELALEDALRRGLTSRARMGYRLRELAGRGREGCAALRALLEDGRERARSGSAPEVRLRRLFSGRTSRTDPTTRDPPPRATCCPRRPRLPRSADRRRVRLRALARRTVPTGGRPRPAEPAH
jgi:hypothetical protein